jgi:hypothetical protein
MGEKLFVGIVFVLFMALICGLAVLPHALTGTGGFGPIRTETVTVESKHVDLSGGGDKHVSHYMVTTDRGTYEVANGWLLSTWNGDEIYGHLRDGRRYELTTKGNRVVGFFFQQYPYITAAREIQATAAK